MSELVWVAVPNGLIPDRAGGVPSKASIRVLVVPRLTGFDIGEDGLQNWPATLAEEAAFTLWTKTSGGVHRAARRPQYVARARSEVWTGFFGGDAGLVDPYVPKNYTTPHVAESHKDALNVDSSYRTVSRIAAVPANDADSAIRTELLTRWAAPEPEQPSPRPGAPLFSSPDFHATVTRLREHPTVLLDLGLIFEVIVNVTDLNVGTAAAGRQLSIRCDDPPPLVGLVTAPWTQYDLDLTSPATGFRPAPGSASGIRYGLLDLSQSTSITSPTTRADTVQWAVTTFDIDGAVSGLRQTARDVAAHPQVDATMPPMRSAGLALLRPERRLDFVRRAQATRDRAGLHMAEAEFTAEDLVLGYYVDIRREGGSWRSVCERDAEYKINGLSIGQSGPVADGQVHEEGHVKGFTALKDDSGGLHTDEVVLRWDGWSLAVPLPNLRGDTSGPSLNSSTPLPYRFYLDFAVTKGTLPLLRFSNRYQMRIRIADIAGGGLQLDDLDGTRSARAIANQAASATVTYRRHDPIQPPRLRATNSFAPGAAIDRMVVRSDKNLTPEQLHAMDPDYPLVESRTLDPPTASLQIVEQHGMLGPPMSDEQSFPLAQRAMGTEGLQDPAAEGVAFVARAEPGGLTREISDDRAWSPDWPEANVKTIELRPHEHRPDPVTIGWSANGNTLKVTLGPAEQATIELSSTIPGDMYDHLAVIDYLSNPPLSSEQTLRGRNPVVTPPRRILVVHAVRTPLAEPRWNLPDTAIQRGRGATDVLLNPTFTAADSGLGLNTDSTGRLNVAAAWDEVEDVGDQATSAPRPVTIEHLHSQPIDRGDPPPLQIRHEFGDTKHRGVTYTVKATSRFREYFKDSEPEGGFQSSHQHAPLNLLSTVRPAAPAVLGVVPGFTWQRTQPSADRIEHTRHAQWLRVELARPWFQTGAGEQLAVVLATSDSDPTAASEWITRVGRDPLFATPSTPPRPTRDWFVEASAAQQAMLSEMNQPVTVIPVDVTPAGDRWYADIAFTAPAAAASYNPLVQLAVARYQRHTIDDLQLSPVVVTDPVPLLPDRHVVLTRTGNQVRITVDGRSPNPPNQLEAILESCGPDIAPEDLDVAVDNAAAEPQLSAWRPRGRVVGETNALIPPLTLVPTPGRLRIRLREIENIPNLPGIGPELPPDLTRRNVFVDTIVLPAGWSTV